MPLAELMIDSIAAGGDGVGRAEGFVVFVPRTAPGDLALVDWSAAGRFGRGTLRTLVTPSPVRVQPPCEHYVSDRCGGCQLQHMAYEAQLDAKGAIVRDSLERIGKRPAAQPPVHPSAEQWRYRRKLTLALRRRGDGWMAGLHPYDAPGKVFELRDCPITQESIVAAWREVMAAADDLPRADELRGAIRLSERGLSFILEGGVRWPRMNRFFERATSLSALWWMREGAERAELLARRLAVPPQTGSALPAQGAPDEPLHADTADEDSGAPGASFEQINAAVAAEVRDHVLRCVLAHSPQTVVDAYSGLGDLAVALASSELRVTAIELDAVAAAWCGNLLPPDSRSVAGRVENVLPSVLPADVVVLNPPRAGVDKRVTDELQAGAAGTRAIIYVSCNPATLARDLSRLPRWRIASLDAFDMFPQTAHVETVCELVPETA